MTNEQDQHGLDLFDQNASAVRGFPNAMLGYEKKAVDDYIRDLERQLSVAKHQMREVQRELTAANLRVDDTDFSKLGAHTANLLKVAEAQAGELLQRAQSRAQAMLSDAEAEVERTRAQAAQTIESARQEGIASIKVLRDDLERQTTHELDAARTEAQGLREAADNHHATVLADAEQQVAALLEGARREADAIREAATREAAEARAEFASEREQALAALQAEQVALTEKMTAATAEARSRSEELLAALTKASEDLRSRQQAAYTEAEGIKTDAINEAAAIIDRARADAHVKLAETDAELVARNDQLKRENRHLRQRKQALLTQLAQLSSFATETASEFPEDEMTGPIMAALAEEPDAGADPAVDGPAEDAPVQTEHAEAITTDDEPEGQEGR